MEMESTSTSEDILAFAADSGSEESHRPSEPSSASESVSEDRESVSESEGVCPGTSTGSTSGGGGVGGGVGGGGGGGRGRGMGRGGMGRGRGGRTGQSTHAHGDEGWESLREPEVYQGWIKEFDEATGYRGDEDLTGADPIEFLSLFLSDDFWNLVTNETNTYAHQVLASTQLRPHSRFHAWYDVSVPEMKAFFALHFSMGLVEKPEIEDYWASFWPTHTPGFAKVMPRNRFEIILSCLHFANNNAYVRSGQPGHDRLFKIRPVIEVIIPRFAELYSPQKELALDEMTIAFKGRSTLKCYNPKKPDKYGYRAYAVSESRSGYVLRWSLHTGQHGGGDPSISATHAVVRDLMAPFTGKGHELYMDSYYMSPAIASELAEGNTGLCGTVRSTRRGMPRSLTPAALRLKSGDDPVFVRRGKLLACAWHDTKRLTMLTTVHSNACVEKRIRTKKTESGFRTINRPVCVDRYNSFMGGVDRADQRMKTYLFPHRSRKWYHRIFDAILSVTVVNSHILYTKCTPGPHKALKVYIQEIITALLSGYKKREGGKGGRPSAEGGEMPARLTERHFLYETDERPDCVVCSDRSRPKGRRQTRYRCRQCGVGLCAVPCNERYHTLKNYKM